MEGTSTEQKLSYTQALKVAVCCLVVYLFLMVHKSTNQFLNSKEKLGTAFLLSVDIS